MDLNCNLSGTERGDRAGINGPETRELPLESGEFRVDCATIWESRVSNGDMSLL